MQTRSKSKTALFAFEHTHASTVNEKNNQNTKLSSKTQKNRTSLMLTRRQRALNTTTSGKKIEQTISTVKTFSTDIEPADSSKKTKNTKSSPKTLENRTSSMLTRRQHALNTTTSDKKIEQKISTVKTFSTDIEPADSSKKNKNTKSSCETSSRLKTKAVAQHPLKKIKVGELCFAKVRGYPEWPALVTKIETNFAWVKFFNSSQSGKCFFGKIYDLHESVRFLEKNVQNSQLQKAVKELAIVLREKLNDKKRFTLKKNVISQYLSLIE